MPDPTPKLRLGPPRVFVPVSVRWPWGFVGGPSGYVERPADDIGECPVILEGRVEEVSKQEIPRRKELKDDQKDNITG